MKVVLHFFILFFVLQSCQEQASNAKESFSTSKAPNIATTAVVPIIDTIILSKKHDPNFVICDLDGDNLSDTVQIVMNTINHKYGLKILFGNSRVELLGMGKDILNQGFDDIEWVGMFEVAPKDGVYYNNVSEDGLILTEDEVAESDKVRLPNDGIFIHQAEACGGGVIYLKDGKFEWIQQE